MLCDGGIHETPCQRAAATVLCHHLYSRKLSAGWNLFPFRKADEPAVFFHRHNGEITGARRGDESPQDGKRLRCIECYVMVAFIEVAGHA